LSNLTLLKLNIAPEDWLKNEEGSDLESFTCNLAEVANELELYLRYINDEKIKSRVENTNHGQKKI